MTPPWTTPATAQPEPAVAPIPAPTSAPRYAVAVMERIRIIEFNYPVETVLFTIRRTGKRRSGRESEYKSVDIWPDPFPPTPTTHGLWTQGSLAGRAANHACNVAPRRRTSYNLARDPWRRAWARCRAATTYRLRRRASARSVPRAGR